MLRPTTRVLKKNDLPGRTVQITLATIWLLSACGSNVERQPGQPERVVDAIGNPLCAGDEAAGISRPAHWTASSHCKGIAPDYDKLFDPTVVHRLEITIDAAVFQQTQQDLSQLLGDDGQGGPPAIGGSGFRWGGIA